MDEAQQEARYIPGVPRTYEDERITVFWDAKLCIHVAECIRHLPDVFDPMSRPWVHTEFASADAIAEAIEACPTGALRYERHDGGPQEPVADPATITPRPNGPLFVRGALRLATPDGETILETPRAALCRCGASGNKPFCDLSHRRINFQA